MHSERPKPTPPESLTNRGVYNVYVFMHAFRTPDPTQTPNPTKIPHPTLAAGGRPLRPGLPQRQPYPPRRERGLGLRHRYVIN